MNNNASEIKLSKNVFEYAYQLLFLLGCFFIFFGFSSILNIDDIFYPLAVICGIIIFSIVLFLIFILTQSNDFVESLDGQQYPKNLDYLNVDHDAIIIVKSKGVHSIGQYAGIDNLIERFIIEKYPFKIYPCDNLTDFKSVLRNENARYIWIFSHGWRGGVVFKDAGKLSDLSIIRPKSADLIYDELRNEIPQFPKKLFIAQLHCNPKSDNPPINTSLPEILMENPSEDDYYVTDGSLNHYAVWFATRKLSFKIRRPSIKEPKTYERGD